MSVMEETKQRDPYTPSATEPGGPPADWQPYRSISRSAIIALVLGVLGSALGLLFPSMLALCVIGLVAGAIGLRSIKKHPLEYTGSGIAKVGMVISLLGLLGGVTTHAVVYYTEVPDGYPNRLSFWELKPNNPQDREIELPERVLELRDQKVFIKGYVHPSVAGVGRVKHFILVGDMGTCCFGGQPNMFDMVEVKLDTPEGIYYSTSLRKFGGTFRYHDPKQVNQLANVIYELDAEYVK